MPFADKVRASANTLSNPTETFPASTNPISSNPVQLVQSKTCQPLDVYEPSRSDPKSLNPSLNQAHGVGNPFTPQTPLPSASILAVSPSEQNYFQAIHKKLATICRLNNLSCFYNSQQIETIALNIATQKNLAQIAQSVGLSPEIIIDLCSLTLYDVYLYGDDSFSMTQKDRWPRLKEHFTETLAITSLFCDNGVNIDFMNTNKKLRGIKNETELADVLQGVFPQEHFKTPLAEMLQNKILHEIISKAGRNNLQRPALILIYTDGEPYPEKPDLTQQAIIESRKKLMMYDYPLESVAFGFIQVGDDENATKFLDSLFQNSTQFSKNVDVTEDYEAEAKEFLKEGISLTRDMHRVKCTVGPVDEDYGEYRVGIHAVGDQENKKAALRQAGPYSENLNSYDFQGQPVMGYPIRQNLPPSQGGNSLINQFRNLF